ncbi:MULTISPECIES: carboxypeptidase-like regulatory domain-containing protein [Acinetobacter]|uniref:Carboxypeptidase regulatory-like domain-containing protein n=1 Tax=Acinetobacter piscicola TaxID=2006115 RepID=A0A7S7AHC6_9GAMM|nr:MULTISPECIES: carboxypeptidase-like regulatory domain-containing protein [Acinetobacter]QOW45541.1 carboxypeptidase regulatory-like domain-containing protein [Acinetobacter piscicola]
MKMIDIGMRSGVLEQYSNGLATNSELSLSGQVRLEGVPARARVVLFERSSSKVCYEAITDFQGRFTFIGLQPNKRFFALAFIRNNQYNAMIFDNLIAK